MIIIPFHESLINNKAWKFGPSTTNSRVTGYRRSLSSCDSVKRKQLQTCHLKNKTFKQTFLISPETKTSDKQSWLSLLQICMRTPRIFKEYKISVMLIKCLCKLWNFVILKTLLASLLSNWYNLKFLLFYEKIYLEDVDSSWLVLLGKYVLDDVLDLGDVEALHIRPQHNQ